MHKSEYNFSSKFINQFNDEVYPGQPFLLHNFSYNVVINPKVKFWRFGIRLSKSKEIEFVKQGDRHLQDNSKGYKDIHLGVGDRLNNEWINENSLYITTYNFGKDIVTSNPIYSEPKYVSQTPINFHFEYNSENSLLSVNADVIGYSYWGTSLKIEPEYKYFQFFAWADFVSFNINTEIIIRSLDKTVTAEESLLPFEVGNIRFRAGDMFDSYAESNSNFVLLPASSTGTATDVVLSYASILGMELPTPQPSGSLSTFPVRSLSKYKRGAYAYSLDGRDSSPQIIETLCKSIIETTKEQSNLDKIQYVVSLPLLGTGAGNLDPIKVVSLYNKYFNGNGEYIQFLVSINKPDIFNNVKTYFLGRYIGLQHENLQKPKSILELENNLNTIIDYSAFYLDENEEVTMLALNHLKLDSLIFLQSFSKLKTLNFLGCKLNNIDLLKKLRHLTSISFISCSISETTIFEHLSKLNYLNFTASSIASLDFLEKLISLKKLVLSGNGLIKLEVLEPLRNLHYLDLSDNKISDISILRNLTKLETLILTNNRITNLDVLIDLKKLKHLYVSSNRILNFSCINLMKSLEILKADQNPFFKDNNLNLPPVVNQLPFIKNMFSRTSEANLKEIKFPVKIMLLGNHQVGKSSLLHFLQENNLNINHDSTHIINIQKFPKNTNGMPMAIFFDFGGQDYYHGIYRAFMSSGSVYLILWNTEFNSNRARQGEGGIITQDFTLNYWIAQKHFFEEEVEKVEEKDPVFVIQTNADKDNYMSYQQTEVKHDIENEFFVSLKKNSLPPINLKAKVHEKSLFYLKESILEIIERKQVRRHEPEWYIKFIEFILSYSEINDYNGQNINNLIAEKFKADGIDAEEALRTELKRLHYEGLILYYDIDELRDTVWLNPSALAQYFHKEILAKKYKNMGGRIKESEFVFPPELIKLLCLQKVIYKHQYGEGNGVEYIIPNFLPLVNEDPKFKLLGYDLVKPDFILKFKYFLPFGLINQFICFYGGYEYQKEFWRDRLIFKFKSYGRVQIHIDFEKLEVRVSINFTKEVNTIEEIEVRRYIFYTIMTLYWGNHKPLQIEAFTNFFNSGMSIDDNSPISDRELFSSCKDIFTKVDCRPYDMFLSTDSIHFVSYRDLCVNKNRKLINAFEIDSNGELVNKSKVVRSSSFKPFTLRDLDAPLKVAISYSTQDVDFLNEFVTHLSSLTHTRLIDDPFYCLKLEAGIEWDQNIQNQFDEVDIIFFLVSHHLMSNKYVLENEIKKSISRRRDNTGFRVIPIILVPCHWERKQTPEYDLSVFTALPFKAQPVTTFPTENDAWFCTIEYIRLWLEKEINPETDELVLSAYTKRVQEKLLAYRLKN